MEEVVLQSKVIRPDQLNSNDHITKMLTNSMAAPSKEAVLRRLMGPDCSGKVSTFLVVPYAPRCFHREARACDVSGTRRCCSIHMASDAHHYLRTLSQYLKLRRTVFDTPITLPEMPSSTPSTT